MANAIVDAVVIEAWRNLLAKGERTPLAALERELPEIVATASALRAVAMHVEAESTEPAIKRRAAAADKAAELRKTTHMVMEGFGVVRRGDQGHVERVVRLASAETARATLPDLRKAVDELRAEKDAAAFRLGEAQHAIPYDVKRIAKASGVFQAAEAAWTDASRRAREAEEEMRKVSEPAPAPPPDVVRKAAVPPTPAQAEEIRKAESAFVTAFDNCQAAETRWRTADDAGRKAALSEYQLAMGARDRATAALNRAKGI